MPTQGWTFLIFLKKCLWEPCDHLTRTPITVSKGQIQIPLASPGHGVETQISRAFKGLESGTGLEVLHFKGRI